MELKESQDYWTCRNWSIPICNWRVDNSKPAKVTFCWKILHLFLLFVCWRNCSTWETWLTMSLSCMIMSSTILLNPVKPSKEGRLPCCTYNVRQWKIIHRVPEGTYLKWPEGVIKVVKCWPYYSRWYSSIGDIPSWYLTLWIFMPLPLWFLLLLQLAWVSDTSLCKLSVQSW